MMYTKAIARTVAEFKRAYRNTHGAGDATMAAAARRIYNELEWAFQRGAEGRGTKHNVRGITVYLPRLDAYTRENVLIYVREVIWQALQR